MKPKTIKEIVEEFKKQDFGYISESMYDEQMAAVVDYFRNALTSLIEQEIAWVEGSKEEISKKHPNWDGKIGYTQACDDIIEHLKELLK